MGKIDGEVKTGGRETSKDRRLIILARVYEDLTSGIASRNKMEGEILDRSNKTLLTFQIWNIGEGLREENLIWVIK